MNPADYIRFALPLVVNGQARALKHRNTLKNVSKLETAKLKEYALNRRNLILRYAFEHVEFYRKHMKMFYPKSRSSEISWLDIPLCDRDVVSPQEEKFISDEYTKRNWKDTSGSTGRKFRFIADPDQALWAEASAAFIRETILRSPVPKELVVWGAARDVPSSMGILSRAKFLVRRRKTCIAYKLDDLKISEILQLACDYHPKLLTSYPNILNILTQSDTTAVLREVSAIMSAGEWLRPDLRNRIESHIGKKIFDFYGTREMGAIAFECSEHNGLHILSPMVFVETIREDGSPCDPEEMGELVLTSLVRKSMPLIRYRIGDMGVLSDQPCSCGITLPLLKDICGRTMDAVTLPDGRRIAGYFWTHFARDLQGVSQFRIVQDSAGFIVLEIVPEDTANSSILQRCRTALSTSLGLRDGFEVSLVQKLPVNQSGKTGLVVSHYRRNK